MEFLFFLFAAHLDLYLLCCDVFFDTILDTAIYIRPRSFFSVCRSGKYVNKSSSYKFQLTIQDRAVQEEEEGESLSDQLEKLLAKYEDSETLQDLFLEGTLW